MFPIFFWLGVLVISLAVLVKGADWLLESAEKIGKYFHLSPFLIGIVLVGIGTSLPELVSSLFAIYAGETNMVVANTVGSNIANILLIIGCASVFVGSLKSGSDVIEVDFPLLAGATVLLTLMSLDGVISFGEAFILTLGLILYFVYAIASKRIIPSNDGAARSVAEKISPQDWILLGVGVLGLGVGAKFVVDAVVALSSLTGFGTGAITLFAVAVGTSLPELLVSIRAALKGKIEMVFGNIFGSNMFNILFIVGVPGLFVRLDLDQETLTYGIPMLVAATILFLVSGLSWRIFRWEGLFFLLVYAYFVASIFGLM